VTREHRITDAFIQLANSLVGDFDVVELLSDLTTNCAEILDIASAGVLLADRRGTLHVVAASSEATWKLELYQLQRDEGPCLECFRSGSPVVVPDLAAEQGRWPRFVDAAIAGGFASVHAVPMVLNGRTLGALGLFGASPGALGDEDLVLAQALAHVGSVALVQGRDAREDAIVAQQLQHALHSRVVLEQAKGIIAQRFELGMEEAFAMMREHARRNRQRLSDVAAALVARTLPVDRLPHGDRAPGRRQPSEG
jgi:hypothetical protein